MEGVTSISTISLVDVDVESFSSYIYQPTPWAKHTKTTVWRAPSLENPSCSKLYFSLLPSPSSSSPRCPAQPSSPRQQVRPPAMSLSIANVAASDRVFVPCNLLFADQQSQGTSLRSLHLSIIVCINLPSYDCFPFVFFFPDVCHVSPFC